MWTNNNNIWYLSYSKIYQFFWLYMKIWSFFIKNLCIYFIYLYLYLYLQKSSLKNSYSYRLLPRPFQLWLSDLSSSSSSKLSPMVSETEIPFDDEPPKFNGPCGEPEPDCCTIFNFCCCELLFLFLLFNALPRISRLRSITVVALAIFRTWSRYFCKICFFFLKVAIIVKQKNSTTQKKKKGEWKW